MQIGLYIYPNFLMLVLLKDYYLWLLYFIVLFYSCLDRISKYNFLMNYYFVASREKPYNNL
jgi:hypothetical protein